MPTSIPSHSPIKNSLWRILLSLLFIIYALNSVSNAKSRDREEAYYYFLLSQIVAKNATEMEFYLKKALEKEKKSIFLKKTLLNIYLHLQNYTQAEKLAKDLKPLALEDREVTLLIARLYLAQNKLDKASQILERFLEKNPKEETILSLLISIYLQQKKWDLALERLNSLSQLYPEEVAFEVFRARIYREKGDFSKAKEFYLRSLETSPNNRALLVEVLRFLENIKDYDSIEKILLRHLSANPEDEEILRLLFGFYFDQGNWEKSEQLLRGYLEKHRDHPEILFYLALTLEHKGNYQEAIRIYDTIPEDSPWYLEAQKRIFNHYKKKNPDKARDIVNRIKGKRNLGKGYYLFLLHSYEDLDLCEEGITLGDEALKAFANDPDIILAVALNYACIEDYEKVLGLVEPLLEKLPDDAYVLNFVGYSLVELNRDLPRAEKLLIRADQLKPNDPYILDSIGWLYFKMGNLEQARFYLEKAVSLLNEEEAVILWHLGDVYKALGDTKKACEFYQRALKAVIHHRERARILEKLKLCP